MQAQAGKHLFVELQIVQKHKLHGSGAGTHEHEQIGGVGGIGVCLAVPCCRVHNVARARHALLERWQSGAAIDVVGSRMPHGAFVARLRPDNHRRVSAANVAHGTSRAAGGTEVVEVGRSLARYEGMTAALRYIFCQMIRHGDFTLGIFRKAHAQRVANAVGQQCADACRALDAPVLALAGFRHAQMQREVHALVGHGLAQQAHGAHHDHGVGGFYRHHRVLKALSHANAQKFHATLHDALGRVAVAAHDAVGQRAVVHADAQRRAVGAADAEQFHEPLFESPQFLCVSLVGVFDMLEFPGRIYVVAGIDAHFLHNLRCHVCHVGVEMYVRHERRVEALAAQCFLNLAQRLRLARALCREAHVVCARLDDGAALCGRCRRVGGRRGGHTLNAQRVVAAERAVADTYLVRLSRRVVKQIGQPVLPVVKFGRQGGVDRV